MSATLSNQSDQHSSTGQSDQAAQLDPTTETGNENSIILKADHLSCLDHREAAQILARDNTLANGSVLNRIGNKLIDTFDAAETLTSSNRKKTPSTVSIALSITETTLLSAGHFEIADDIAADYPHGADRHRSKGFELLNAVLDHAEDLPLNGKEKTGPNDSNPEKSS